MSIMLAIGALISVASFYLAKKAWQGLHKAVGISPGVLIYNHPDAPLVPANLSWQQLTLDKQHLSLLSDQQLRQLQAIDQHRATYQRHQYQQQQYQQQQQLAAQNITPAITEQQFILHKLLHTRLAEMLASYYHLVSVSSSASKQAEAGQLLQDLLDNIEQRQVSLLAQIEDSHLQDLRIMKRYMDKKSGQ
jgi:hypothetical protein